jgi:hypothetical protein
VSRVLALAALLALPACWPGRCEGGFRALLPQQARITPATGFWVNADSSRRTPDELLASSGISAESLFLVGPGGPVPAAIAASSVDSAHSCASAASFSLTPAAPLPPGDYHLVLRLDLAKWPAVRSGEVSQHDGHRAMVRRYTVAP